MVQGAVASESFGVEFVFTRDRLLCTVYGAPVPSAHELLKVLLSGGTPSDRGLHHWIVALRSLYGETREAWGWTSCREGAVESVRFEAGEPMTEFLPDGPDEVDTLRVTIALRRTAHGAMKLGVDEYYLLCRHCGLCTMPVTVDSRLISQQHPGSLARGRYAALWLEKGSEVDSFPISISATKPGKSVPTLIATKTLADDEAAHPCSLMVSVSPARLWRPAFEVYWLRDGAMMGPREVLGGPPELDIVVVCPGDRLATDLTEWALREPERCFPGGAILKVMQEIGVALHPRIAKSVKFEQSFYLPWLKKLWIIGQLLEPVLLLFAQSENQVGLPAEFVNAIVELGRRSEIRLRSGGGISP